MKKRSLLLAAAVLTAALALPAAAEEATVVPNADIVHAYLTTTEQGIAVAYDAEKGATFSKSAPLTSYERIGTSWTAANYQVDGLRLEFTDVTMKNEGEAIPRISVELTPNTDGATFIGTANNQGLLFIPAKGFFGDTDLILNLGNLKSYPDDYVKGLNVLEAFYVREGEAPFAHLTEENASYSIQFNKVGDDYIIAVDDCAYYRVPASIIDESISNDIEGYDPAPTFIYEDLPAGNAVINLRTWSAGKSFQFTWSAITTGAAAAADLPVTLTEAQLKAALAAKGDAASVTYGDAPSIELPAGATLADLEAALSISDDFTYVVKSGADAVTGATTPLTAEMTLRLFTGDSPVANGVFAIKLKEETPATTTTTATPTTAATSPTSGTVDVPATGGGLPWPALLLLPAAGLALALAAGRKRAAR